MMTTNSFFATMKAARRRQARRAKFKAEFRAFCSGGALVLTGLLLAALYCTVTHRLGA